VVAVMLGGVRVGEVFLAVVAGGDGSGDGAELGLGLKGDEAVESDAVSLLLALARLDRALEMRVLDRVLARVLGC
jgi:hypothetical protein